MIDVVHRWPSQRLHLARVPTAILYDDERKVSATPAATGNLVVALLTSCLGYKLLSCGADARDAARTDNGPCYFNVHGSSLAKKKFYGGWV